MNETLKEHLYKVNSICPKCRWNESEICKNSSTEFFNKSTKYIEENCNSYYPSDDLELFETEDDNTDSLFV